MAGGSEKILAVQEWPVPKDNQEIHSFLVLCTYYRRFISGFPNFAKPLTKATEEGCRFTRTVDFEHAFSTLKNALITTPVLGYCQMGENFVLHTSASNTTLGGLPSIFPDHSVQLIRVLSIYW